MAFGQSAGPAASHRQVAELLRLVPNAGHADFTDARGLMGLNQRHTASRFSGDEARAAMERAVHAASTESLALEVGPKAPPVTSRSGGAEGNRTPDPLLAKQVL